MTIKAFADTLVALRYGQLHDELSVALHDLIKACVTTGSSGSLSLTIKLKPGRSGQIEIGDEVRLKLPEPQKTATLMFATPDGILQREDPRQIRIDEVRTIDVRTSATPIQVN